jgi:hypothetical protein
MGEARGATMRLWAGELGEEGWAAAMARMLERCASGSPKAGTRLSAEALLTIGRR